MPNFHTGFHAQVEAAEELFEVLTHPIIAKRKVPVLIACNKMDLETQVCVGDGGGGECACVRSLACVCVCVCARMRT